MTYFKAFAKEAVFSDSSSEAASLCLAICRFITLPEKNNQGCGGWGGGLYLNDTGKIPVLWAPHPHLLMWSKVLL